MTNWWYFSYFFQKMDFDILYNWRQFAWNVSLFSDRKLFAWHVEAYFLGTICVRKILSICHLNMPRKWWWLINWFLYSLWFEKSFTPHVRVQMHCWITFANLTWDWLKIKFCCCQLCIPTNWIKKGFMLWLWVIHHNLHIKSIKIKFLS